MENKNFDIGSQIFIFLYKYGTYIALILLGIVGRFSLNLLHNKKMTLGYIIGYSGLSFVVGYVTTAWMLQRYPDKVSIVLPLITMISNNIISMVLSIAIEYKSIKDSKWKGILEIIFKDTIGKKRDEE